ncbi:hypothetical protein DL98DRAFT_587401 [Cadophora sp. DSE1049]|nr:hypothetical protein DL98DRAFT_587401 [Cadophora sp. DSE1049]
MSSPAKLQEPLSGTKTDPQPILGRPKSPGAVAQVAESSSGLTPLRAPTLAAPPCRVFSQKGREVYDNHSRASGPDNDHDYPTKSKCYSFVVDTPASPFEGDRGKVGKNLEAPFAAMGLKDNGEWILREIYGDDLGAEETNVVYHNKEQQSMVVTDTYNDRLGIGFDLQNKIFHSEFIFQGWKAAAGDNVAKLQNVVVAQIRNNNTRRIIKYARTSITKTSIAGQKVTFTAAAHNDAELQGFFALAGTENGKMVFRMLADHHNEMNERRIVAVHTWDDMPDTPDPVLIWQLE